MSDPMSTETTEVLSEFSDSDSDTLKSILMYLNLLGFEDVALMRMTKKASNDKPRYMMIVTPPNNYKYCERPFKSFTVFDDVTKLVNFLKETHDIVV